MSLKYPIELKVKAKSLAEESKIIRKEENKSLESFRIMKQPNLDIFEKHKEKELKKALDKFNQRHNSGNSSISFEEAREQITEEIERKFAKYTKKYIAVKNKNRLRNRSIHEYNKLREHRIVNVREEARATHLARAFLAGYSYRDIEQNVKTNFSSYRVSEIVKRYGGDFAGHPIKDVVSIISDWVHEEAE